MPEKVEIKSEVLLQTIGRQTITIEIQNAAIQRMTRENATLRKELEELKKANEVPDPNAK